MHKNVSLFSSLVFLLICLQGTAQISFLYVSTTGNDRNHGSKDRPFSSLAHAQEKAKKLKTAVTIYIRKGIYYLDSTWVFTASDSRAKGSQIVYSSYPGEKVTISGAKALKLTWEPVNGHIMRATVDTTWRFDQLFINGVRQQMARYPNYNPSSSHFNGFAADAISPQRILGWDSPAGGFIHALHKHEWGGYQYEIKSKVRGDSLKLVGGFQNNRQLGMHDRYRFVENVFEELDTAGEWFYNKKEQMLYFYPPAGLDLANARIEIPQLDNLIEFRGSIGNPVKHITLRSLTFTHSCRTFMKTKESLLRSDWTIYRGGAILLDGTAHCNIRDCVFDQTGGNAVFYSNYNRYDTISSCIIDRAGASGICYVGDPAAVRSPSFEYNQSVPLSRMDTGYGPITLNYPANCYAFDNLIRHAGRVEKQVAGVEISMSLGITVSHNTIYDLPRAGINISEGTWGGHIIEFNDVFETVMETGDHGAFNSWGRDRYWHPSYDSIQKIIAIVPSLVRADVVKTIIIRNNRFRCDHGWDIDLDDGSSNYHIYNNVCLNGGLKLREGYDRRVENNILVNNSFHPHVWFKKSRDIFRHNILMRSYFPIRVNDWGDEVDYNLFPDTTALGKTRAFGTDQHSIASSPMFIDPTIGDYRVAKNSPALKIGFTNFDMKFGVVSAHLRKLAAKVEIPLITKPGSVMVEGKVLWYGATIKDLLSEGERSATGMYAKTGVLVVSIPASSPLAGLLKSNDVILALETENILRVPDLLKAREQFKFQKPLHLKVFRDQQIGQMLLTLPD